MVPAGRIPSGPITGALSCPRYSRHKWQGGIRYREENARHCRPAALLITRQAAKVISDDYRHWVISAVKSVHWSVSSGAAIGCGAVGADANAQHAAGESIEVRARLIS